MRLLAPVIDKNANASRLAVVSVDLKDSTKKYYADKIALAPMGLLGTEL